jgi:rhodanese-related sulfurtransferase
MKKLSVLLITALTTVGLLAGCSASESTTLNTVGTSVDGNELKIEAAAVKLVKAVEKGGYQLTNTEELKTWIDEGKNPIVIDTMPADFYGKGHIPTALNAVMPKTGLGDATDEEKEAFKTALGDDKDALIVIYCGFTACGRSDAGATYAIQEGYTNVYRQPGGIIAWRNAGYEEEK